VWWLPYVAPGAELQMREPLFDLSAEYEHMLNQGIRLSGEDRTFSWKAECAT